MKNGKIVDRAGKFSLVDTGTGTYAVALGSRFGAQSLSSFFDLGGRSWDKDPQTVGGVNVVPWGPDDQMPRMVRDLLEKNNIGPGILSRKVGLIYGQGLQMYRNVIEQNEVQQQWTDDRDVRPRLHIFGLRRKRHGGHGHVHQREPRAPALSLPADRGHHQGTGI